MKLKSLLLGTAAAFAVSGGAQAADLALAVEPIDYVKVCDAFGTGYYYIPGTDTCLRIGGYVQLDVWFYDDDKVGNIIGFSDWNAVLPYATGSHVRDEYDASWEFKSETGVNFTAKSMSDLGPIVAFAEFRAASNNDDAKGLISPHTRNAYADQFYGAIGPIMFGYTTSTFDVGGGYTYDGAVRSDKKADQIRLSYLMGTWGIMLGLEDPRDRYDYAKNATGDWPDIILALTGGVAGFDVKASVGFTDRTSGTGWGVALAAEAALGAAAKIKVAGAYSDNAKSYTGGSNCTGVCDDGEWWSAFISGSVALSGNMSLAATASYQDAADGRNGLGAFTGAIGAYYYPSGNSEIGLELLYTDPETGSDSWGVHGRFKTTFGG